MKKTLVTLLAVAALTLSANALNVISTNLTTGGTFLLSTSALSVKSVMVSSANAGLVQMLDADTLSGYSINGGTVTNITPAYVGTLSYITNTVATNTIGLSGYTNYYTNSGMWTYTATVAAATNVLTPVAAYGVAAGTMGTYSTDIQLMNGLTVVVTTNVAITLYYDPR